MKKSEVDTKERILAVASDLFAQQGFSATSIREIAKEADVNIAAVNYHFKNKKNLQHEILKAGYLLVSSKINKYVERKNPKFVDLCEEIFKVMMKNQSTLLNNLKIMLSQDAEDLEDFGSEDELIGPPGGMALYETLSKEVPSHVTEDQKRWAIYSIMSKIIHTSSMLSCPCADKPNIKKYLSRNSAQDGVKELAKALLFYLENGLKA